MTQLAIVDAYNAFMVTAKPFVSIASTEDYESVLSTLEQILESSSDTLDDPMNPLIDMLSLAIERYEDHELMTFVAEAEAMPTDLALLRTLMRQNNLTGSDLPEIGDKTMVSRVLNGKRELNRHAIEKLSKRFNLRPSIFFGD